MSQLPNYTVEMELLFTEDQWNAAMPILTRDMAAFLAKYRTPIFKDRGDYGEGWGSGSFIDLDGNKYILTNEHVTTIRHGGDKLGFHLNDQDQLIAVTGNHVEQAWPWDLAILPVPEASWTSMDHTSQAICIDQISLAHTPVKAEIFAFTGFAGERTAFHFNTLLFQGNASLSREIALPVGDDRWDHRFHFGLDYRPDHATDVIGDKGLPKPPGLSGSTVWNTCFVEAKMRGIDWTPDLARVAGVVWGWPSSVGSLIATRAEHVRSFLLEARTQLNAERTIASRDKRS